MAVEHVSVREFDNFVREHNHQLETVWKAIEDSTKANTTTAKNVAVLSTQMTEDREDRKIKDQRVWALTLTFISVMFMASIPFLVKAANLVLGTIV